MPIQKDREPIVVQDGKPFSINPNTNRETVPQEVTDNLAILETIQEEGKLTDIVRFTVDGEKLSGKINVISVHTALENLYETVRFPAGDAHPITFDIDLYHITEAQANANTIGFMVGYLNRRYLANIEYEEFEDEPGIGSWVENWTDMADGETVVFAVPPNAVPQVEFQVFTNLHRGVLHSGFTNETTLPTMPSQIPQT